MLTPIRLTLMHTTPLATVTPIRPDLAVPAPVATFQVGTAYTTGRGDYEWSFLVTARTAKFITITDPVDGKSRRVGVTMSWTGDSEVALPLGKYSMAPVINADRPAEAA